MQNLLHRRTVGPSRDDIHATLGSITWNPHYQWPILFLIRGRHLKKTINQLPARQKFVILCWEIFFFFFPNSIRRNHHVPKMFRGFCQALYVLTALFTHYTFVWLPLLSMFSMAINNSCAAVRLQRCARWHHSTACERVVGTHTTLCTTADRSTATAPDVCIIRYKPNTGSPSANHWFAVEITLPAAVGIVRGTFTNTSVCHTSTIGEKVYRVRTCREHLFYPLYYLPLSFAMWSMNNNNTNSCPAVQLQQK